MRTQKLVLGISLVLGLLLLLIYDRRPPLGGSTTAGALEALVKNAS